ncbi:hypothetical protein L1987_04035 [Smallanthus sonchifolius]|uniref:Uncharacterized protein n=1 Tax=Smallanthus sonchifolius TaxID=185202 RepID=A0ACB9KCB6_9ASTR|nr:hypothetical protein L1987_04035 [Smallanthus sonchifolius]
MSQDAMCFGISIHHIIDQTYSTPLFLAGGNHLLDRLQPNSPPIEVLTGYCKSTKQHDNAQGTSIMILMVKKSKTTSTKSMNHLSNAFSLLELDVEDDRKETTSSANNPEKANGDSKKETDIHKNVLEGDYRLPLVWIDLEMTGLNIEVDRILEIACVITDGKLTESVEGPDLVIQQTKKCLDEMGEWCQSHHAASGLTERVIQSTISEKEAEQQVVEFVKKHVGTYTPLLAGNSVYVDFMFLKKYMPDLASLFSHVVVDVSSIKALCARWFPKDKKKAPKKEKKHRAMDDIKESITELKYYKENVFKSIKSRK